MKLKTELVLLSVKMIITGFIAEYVKKCLLCLVFSDKPRSTLLMCILEKALSTSRLSFVNTEKSYNILIHHTSRRLQPQ